MAGVVLDVVVVVAAVVVVAVAVVVVVVVVAEVVATRTAKEGWQETRRVAGAGVHGRGRGKTEVIRQLRAGSRWATHNRHDQSKT